MSENIKEWIKLQKDHRAQLEKLKQIYSQRLEYRDLEFPANEQSLIQGINMLEYKGQWSQIGWKTTLGDNNKFLHDFNPQNFSFGQVFNNDFLNAMGILSYRKELIRQLFEFKSLRSNCCGIWLFVGGRWSLVIVDLSVPVSRMEDQTQPVFSFNINGDPWLQLIEKAYAKLLGSYYKLQYPNAIATIQNFTGLPLRRMPMEPVSLLWKEIKASLQRKFIVAGFLEDENIEKVFLLEVFYQNEREGVRIVRVAKGFHKFDWDGEWAFHDSRWTRKMREELGYFEEDQSFCWMSIEDCAKLFTSVS